MQNYSQQFFGTYAVMIAKNIFNKFGLYPSNDELMDGLKNKDSVYHPILIVPMANILNGLILSQIETYKLFCQKRLCDFIIYTNPTPEQLAASNGEDNLPDSFQIIHEEYELQEKKYLNLENSYYQQLSDTQGFLIKYIKSVLIRFASYQPTYDEEFFEKIEELSQKTEEIKVILIENKQLWKDFTTKLIKVITELGVFTLPVEEDLEQRGELVFFEKLGLNEL